MALRDHSESRLHIAVVQYLKGEIRSGKNIIQVQKPFPDMMFLHPVNEYKDEKEAFWAKAKGIMPGAADLLFWWQPKNFLPCFGAVELKTNTGLSANQKNFSIKFQAMGGKYAICKSVAQVRDCLIGWGLSCKNTQVIEPKPSQQELQAGYLEMLRQHEDI